MYNDKAEIGQKTLNTTALTPVDPANDLYNFAVFIGRFRPLHLGHIDAIRQALSKAKNVAIIVGSCFAPRSERNPFLFAEVQMMIRASFTPEEQNRLYIFPVPDTPYNDTLWNKNVVSAVNDAHRLADIEKVDGRVTLIGYNKDETSWYLTEFPQWDFTEVSNFMNLNATDVRNELFCNKKGECVTTAAILTPAVQAFLRDFTQTEDYHNLWAEVDYNRKYREAFDRAAEEVHKLLGFRPSIKHQTVDACVIQSGNILLIERKLIPGKGLVALPGGFLDDGEWHEDGMIRELREETKIKVPVPILRSNIVHAQTFDWPHRSARGRVITEAFLIHLPAAPELPKVKARSDAKRAFWMPLADLRREMFFEDHYDIIQTLVAKLDKTSY